ncbi:uncharacterized protein LOC130119781 [Lampris incognitus]|uniref:uncharacterized protein LOC130119781 n=1 Tax=Lampris incognitus TaxID=2546036 RepID=UPI0024B626E5|nr:uncharacterized protein LOC130119781 [Lampris incognitus]
MPETAGAVSACLCSDTNRNHQSLSYCPINPKAYMTSGFSYHPPQPTIQTIMTKLCSFTKDDNTACGIVGVLPYDLLHMLSRVCSEPMAITSSVPFDHILHKNMLALGKFVTSCACDKPLYNQLYVEKDFTRFILEEVNGSGINYVGNYFDIKATMSLLGKAIMKVEVWDKLLVGELMLDLLGELGLLNPVGSETIALPGAATETTGGGKARYCGPLVRALESSLKTRFAEVFSAVKIPGCEPAEGRGPTKFPFTNAYFIASVLDPAFGFQRLEHDVQLDSDVKDVLKTEIKEYIKAEGDKQAVSTADAAEATGPGEGELSESPPEKQLRMFSHYRRTPSSTEKKPSGQAQLTAYLNLIAEQDSDSVPCLRFWLCCSPG